LIRYRECAGIGHANVERRISSLKEKEIVIIGCGMHKFGRFPEESYMEIGREAIKMALQDAGIGWREKG